MAAVSVGFLRRYHSGLYCCFILVYFIGVLHWFLFSSIGFFFVFPWRVTVYRLLYHGQYGGVALIGRLSLLHLLYLLGCSSRLRHLPFFYHFARTFWSGCSTNTSEFFFSLFSVFYYFLTHTFYWLIPEEENTCSSTTRPSRATEKAVKLLQLLQRPQIQDRLRLVVRKFRLRTR